jgi:MFS family permease
MPEHLPAAVVATYALAAAGCVIGYAPLLSLLLPLKLEAIAGIDAYAVLAACGVAGATAAGLANIAFGWLGDRSAMRGHGRRGWAVAGSVATALSFAGIVVAREPATIVASIVLFQIAINAVLAQVGALIAEEVPAVQKGTATALLTLGNPVAAAVSALVVAVVAGEGARLAIVAALMTACVAPLLLARSRPLPPAAAASVGPTRARVATRRDLAAAWAARLLMQIASCAVGLYLLFYVEALAVTRSEAPAIVARLLVVGTVLPVPVALVLGRWSDRIGRRTPFLTVTAVLAALALAGMAAADAWTTGAIAYVVFASANAIFLALNTGHAMLLMPDGTRRGRDLGLLNLANTIPQVVAPLLAWWWTAAGGFGTALSVLAVLTLLAGLLPPIVGEGR